MKEISTTIHDAKTHLSKYLVMLENKEIDKLIIKRRDKEVGALVFHEAEPDKQIVFGILEGQFEFDENDLRQSNDELMQDVDEAIDHLCQSLDEATE